MAQIDNEIARANEVRGYLADRRDRAVSRANLLSVLVGGAVGATSSGLQLSSNLTKPAAGVGIGAGTLSAGLALAGIHQEKGQDAVHSISNPICWQNFSTGPLCPTANIRRPYGSS